MAFSVVNFDGTNDYLARGADLTGIADSKEAAFVIRLDTLMDGAFQDLIRSQNSRFLVQKRSTNVIRVEARNAANTVILRGDSSSTLLSTAGITTVFIGVNLATGAVDIYFDDTDVSPASPIATNDTMDLAGSTNWGVMATYTGGSKATANNEFIWFNDAYTVDGLDFTVQADRDLYATTTSLGSDGSGPTGVAPLVYLTGAASVWNAGTNQGGGGNFTMNGAVTDVGGASSILLQTTNRYYA